MAALDFLRGYSFIGFRGNFSAMISFGTKLLNRSNFDSLPRVSIKNSYQILIDSSSSDEGSDVFGVNVEVAFFLVVILVHQR